MASAEKRIAFVVEDDGRTISAHFGRARRYLVVNMEGGQIGSREMRDKYSGHGQGAHEEQGPHQHERRHQAMFAAIQDCQHLVAGGMGEPAFRGLQAAGIEPTLTEYRDVDEALAAWLAGELEHRPERVHRHGGGQHRQTHDH
jgi:predicted Fe-Mo cluster-binding NifX family protein